MKMHRLVAACCLVAGAASAQEGAKRFADGLGRHGEVPKATQEASRAN